MKKLYTMLIAFLMMMPSFAPALAAENNESVIEATTSNITAKSAIAVDENTGQILYSKDENTVRPIASMSKIVAAYLIMKSVKEGQMHWNQRVSINKSLEEVSNNSELTNVPLSSNQTYTVRNLLDASLIYSANAAILALGKAQAGTSEKFVNEMRATVKKLGIKDAKLYNAAGLLESQVGSEKYPGTSGNIENEMSAKDMAIVISHVLKEFPEILNITKIQKTTFNTGKEELEITNHNELLKGAEQYETKYQIDGLKTGTSDKAGEDFSATGKIKGHRVISVVLGSSENRRFTDTKTIWNALMTKLVVLSSNLKNQASVKINSAKVADVKLELAQPLDYWVPKGRSEKLHVNAIKLNDPKQKAPIKHSKVIATANVKGNQDQFLENGKGVHVKLKPTQDVKKANIFVRLGRSIADWFS
ncbi:MAG: D-alanyl-D-alanine carboxypeptidase [Pediococcus pentosaceus]|jgi:D-alanyl-D-alanine carboxypeptidase (penicillin-binding protein 5/6)|nr:D-alanyl-D-alanine carboxypeptidase [Pediococcus pentosaceus]MCI1472050.1 D-alanyl-D-alanine carboxypeptidase [Pediococcus pentosaceus]